MCPPVCRTPTRTSPPAPREVPAYAAAVQPELDRIMRDLAITGAAVLVRSPELGDWATTMGTRTWHGTEPVTLAEHVRVGSNTKTMTATVILQLVDEGRISLDDPVSRYRPDVPNGENITIAQLLDMTSGLAPSLGVDRGRRDLHRAGPRRLRGGTGRRVPAQPAAAAAADRQRPAGGPGRPGQPRLRARPGQLRARVRAQR